jgi:hypothetical protein
VFPHDFSSIERRRLCILSVLLFLALSLPYVWAWLTTPGDGTYSGLLYNPDDQNVHLSWARQAHDGAFFFRDVFTTEGLASGERPLFTNVLAWAMGVIARLTTLPLIAVYHGFRSVFALLALWWFAALCAHITSDKRVRVLAPTLMAFGGGGGWLLPLFSNRQFIDRADTPNGFPMMPEAFTFHSAFVFPLFIVSVALLPLIYLWTLRAQESGERKPMIGAGVAALLLANIHTYNAIPLLAIMLLWAALSTQSSTRFGGETARKPWLPPLVVVTFMVPQLLYQRLVFAGSEEFRVKALSPKPSPPLVDLLLSYSPTMLLAIVGVWLVWRSRGTEKACCPFDGAYGQS